MKSSVTLLCVLATCFFSRTKTAKTPGQELDSALQDVRSNITNIWKFVKNLQQKYDELIKDMNSTKPTKKGNCVCPKSKSPTTSCDCTILKPKRDCLAFYNQGIKVNGIYKLNIGGSTVNAYCDQTTQGGGWTVIQRRINGSVDFYRTWKEYKNGFGNVAGEFWFGNEKIHHLTLPNSQLLINLKLAGKQLYAKYGSFGVSDEQTKYTLSVFGYSGTAKDGLADHDGIKFTTKDQDNDELSSANCADLTYAGWWYYACYTAILNARYTSNQWPTYQNPTFVEMKVRRIKGRVYSQSERVK